MIDVFAGGIASRNHFKDKKDLAVIDAAVRKHGSNPKAHWSINHFHSEVEAHWANHCQSAVEVRRRIVTE